MKSPLMFALLGSLGLSACAISPGFKADPWLEQAKDNNATVLVAITEMTLPRGGRYRKQFFKDVKMVEATIAEEEGFLGFSKRAEPFGSRAWTMSVWEDEGALAQFIYSADHSVAVDRSKNYSWNARFVQFEVAATEIPVSWDRVVEELDANGRNRVSKGR